MKIVVNRLKTILTIKIFFAKLLVIDELTIPCYEEEGNQYILL